MVSVAKIRVAVSFQEQTGLCSRCGVKTGVVCTLLNTGRMGGL